MMDTARILLDTINTVSLLFEQVFLPILSAWWWVPVPFFLMGWAWNQWLYWRRLDNFKNRNYILLELKLPEDIRKPVRAMEDVFTSMYGVALEHAPTYRREEWIEGEISTLYPTFSLEIVGINGETRFFIWVEEHLRNTVEAIFHAQYPDLEIVRAEDYTKKVPQDIPNKEWDLELRDWVLNKNSVYPLRTYKDFETGAETKEEKRVDPVARLFEAFGHLKEGEQVWLQFTMTDAGKDWVKKGKQIRDELVKREPESGSGAGPPSKPMIIEAIDLLFFGIQEESEKEEKRQMLPPEMMLTPGEREKVEAIENKMSKQGFKVGVRIIYLARREVMFKPHLGLPISFLTSLGTGDQYLKPYKPTTSKVKSLIKVFNLDKRKAFLRKRRAFRNYQWRVNPDFPEDSGISVLTPDELATLFHFPGAVAAPGASVERMEHRRGAPPSSLPTE